MIKKDFLLLNLTSFGSNKTKGGGHATRRLGSVFEFFALWCGGVVLARLDKFLTVEQMRSHGPGFERGIPLDGHMAMKYLDALPFPVLMATWVTLYGYQWTRWQIVTWAIVGLVLSAIMHFTYIEGGKKFPEFVTYGGKLTRAGRAHVVYMGYGFAIIGLAYFCTAHPTPSLVWLTTTYLVIHVTIGVHVIHKLLAPAWFPYHGIMDVGTLAPILGVMVILGGMTWWILR